MNPNCIDILTRLSLEASGSLSKQTLYEAYPNGMRYIASLGTGTRPNIYLDSERNVYQLTQRGYDSMSASGCNMRAVRATRESLPDFIRDATNGSAYRARNARRAQNTNANIANLIEFEIDRNEYVKITCRVHNDFKNWVKSHGSEHNFYDDYGSDAVRNWDATNETKYMFVTLGNIDGAQGSANIVTNAGINSLLIKLACASETNEYTVKYRGLVAWDVLQNYSAKIGESVVMFYKNYVKPCTLKIAVQYLI